MVFAYIIKITKDNKLLNVYQNMRFKIEKFDNQLSFIIPNPYTGEDIRIICSDELDDKRQFRYLRVDKEEYEKYSTELQLIGFVEYVNRQEVEAIML